MLTKCGLAIILFFFCSCNEKLSIQDSQNASQESPKGPLKKNIHSDSKTIGLDETKIEYSDLVDVQEINPDIKIELKYSTFDNFMKMRLYEKISKAYLQKDVAERLSKVQSLLSKKKSGYHLLIYDAFRPVSVQRKMWEALDSIPTIRRGKFVSNPDKRSLHNMGAAVDITIIDDRGIPLDMGAGFDDIREIAYPIHEARYLKSGELSSLHLENRMLLRRLMQSQGFRQLETEWWHYNACSRNEALSKYKVYLEEF